MVLSFEYKADQKFFLELFSLLSEKDLAKFHTFFDFRTNTEKRKEFNKIRNDIYRILVSRYGEYCMLKYNCCDPESGFAVDHVIPLTTNKLNKELRVLKAEKGKKVKSQHFGSNHINNLILACNKCNNHKKHRILDNQKLQKILILKGLI